MIDILGKYESEKKTREQTSSPERPASSSFRTRQLLSGASDFIRSARESQLPFLVLSGIMIVFSLFILFDFIAPAPARIEPLPVGAFPTLELRRTSALNPVRVSDGNFAFQEAPQDTNSEKPFLHAFR